MFFTFGIRTYKYTNLFCSLQILSTLYVDWYHLHDCAMAHQRIIFQESECRCPLKEDVKVDDGFGKLAFWKPKSNLTQAQNELPAFTSHFLYTLLFIEQIFTWESSVINIFLGFRGFLPNTWNYRWAQHIMWNFEFGIWNYELPNGNE